MSAKRQKKWFWGTVKRLVKERVEVELAAAIKKSEDK
jgi:hypothetical protein